MIFKICYINIIMFLETWDSKKITDDEGGPHNLIGLLSKRDIYTSAQQTTQPHFL